MGVSEGEVVKYDDTQDPLSPNYRPTPPSAPRPPGPREAGQRT